MLQMILGRILIGKFLNLPGTLLHKWHFVLSELTFFHFHTQIQGIVFLNTEHQNRLKFPARPFFQSPISCPWPIILRKRLHCLHCHTTQNFNSFEAEQDWYGLTPWNSCLPRKTPTKKLCCFVSVSWMPIDQLSRITIYFGYLPQNARKLFTFWITSYRPNHSPLKRKT